MDADLTYAGKLAEIGLDTAFFGPEVLTHGLLGGGLRIGGGYLGSGIGEKAFGNVGR